MCFVVVDPLLLVRAYEYPHSAPAQLLALFIYGRTCAAANGLRLDELEAMCEGVDPSTRAALHARAERAREVAQRRKELLEDVFEQFPPDDLLLVTSRPLRAELTECARRAQGAGRPHVQPDRVNRQIMRWTGRELGELGPVPRYLDRSYRREYLIHMAILARAESLVTEDELLRLRGDTAHSDPTTRRRVRPCSLEGLVRDRVPTSFNFDAIDAPAVFRAAARQLGRE